MFCSLVQSSAHFAVSRLHVLHSSARVLQSCVHLAVVCTFSSCVYVLQSVVSRLQSFFCSQSSARFAVSRLHVLQSASFARVF